MKPDHYEETEPMYGTLDAELEVQRTIKRAELTALLCIGPTVVHVDNERIIGGLWSGRNAVHWPMKQRTPTCGC